MTKRNRKADGLSLPTEAEELRAPRGFCQPGKVGHEGSTRETERDRRPRGWLCERPELLNVEQQIFYQCREEAQAQPARNVETRTLSSDTMRILSATRVPLTGPSTATHE